MPLLRTRRLSPLALALCCLSSVCVRAQVTVIDEDFEAGAPAGLSIVGNGLIQDDGCGNQVLALTQGANDQGTWAWFDSTFDLNTNRVEIELDLLVGRGASVTPADGISVIFQFDEDLAATGDRGGHLGVGNFRQNNSPYIAVGVDIWDNGATDPETPCDGRYGPDSTCHLEIIQNALQPAFETSPALGTTSPDFIASADAYGLPPASAGSCSSDDLIHMSIVFDNRLMVVTVRGGLSDDGVTPFPETTVISYATAPFPAERLTNLGFGGFTGGANAVQWVDNIVVREGESKVTIEKEPLLTQAGLNCAGPAVDATAEVGATFRADGPVGSEVSRTGDLINGLIITESRMGRIPVGADYSNANARPIDVAGIPGAGAQTAKLLVNDAWSPLGVRYQAEVVPGRYDVSLYWSENFDGAIDGAGRGTKLYDVLLGGTRVLHNFSAAAAAGSGTGSGDPTVPCVGVLDTAVRKTISIDVPDSGGGVGLLDLLVDDLGGGNPPENAALNAFSFRRTGNVTGGAASGDLQSFGVPPGAPPPPAPLIDTDYDADDPDLCPEGMVCNGINYTPKVVDGRLRVTEDLIGSIAATAVFEQCVDPLNFSLEAEFDLYMSWEDDQPPADGGSFFVVQGDNPNVLGGGGGANGTPTNLYGFAVEFDTWDNGLGVGDTSGYNGLNQWVHVGINTPGYESTITNTDYDPDLKPVAFGGTGWPNFRDPNGVHVKVTYNAGLVTVELEGTTDEFDGFGPVIVAQAEVPPVWTSQAVAGFSGGTGGANQTLELDNVVLHAAPCTQPTGDPIAEALQRARDRWTNEGELYINCGGPMLLCSSRQFPAPVATGDAGEGDTVVWVGDQVGGGAAEFDGEFFTVRPAFNQDGSPATLQVAGTDMGLWDARGTSAGVDDNDRIFHTVRFSALQYDVPATNGTYDVTLYFANNYSGTAGTAQRVFHVYVEDFPLESTHCQFSSKPIIGAPRANPFFSFDTLFDPVDAAEQLYAAGPCNFESCGPNGVTVTTDPDSDRVLANAECGNAAAVALQFEAEVTDGVLSIILTPPDIGGGEPASPDGNPDISGIAIRRQGTTGGPTFHRGDADDNGQLQLTDAVRILGFLFLGGAAPTCLDAGDADDNGQLQLTDAVRILGFLFLGGPPPAAPGPPTSACGVDPTPDDALDCASYTKC